jgi:FtsP/CotA-like multicopper oxidase with cupredoxin domain
MFTRRDMLKLGIAGTGYFFLGPDGKISYADDTSLPPSPTTTPFLDELPVPPVARAVDALEDPVGLATFYDTLPDEYKRYWVNIDTTLFFKIAAEVRFVKVHSMLPPVAVWGYRDLVRFPPTTPDVTSPFALGPTLVQLHGDAGPTRDLSCPYSVPPTEPARPIGGGVVVRHINCLRLPKDFRGFGVPRNTVHLHGGHHLARADGFPENIENRPGNTEVPDGFPCFVVSEPPEFVRPPDEPVCETRRTPVSEISPPNGDLVGERQIIDYFYPVLDPGELDSICGRPLSTGRDPSERPSTQWYHDHLLDFTGPNAYRGLAGFVLCFDEVDTGNEQPDPDPNKPTPNLHLPSGPFDIPLAIQDKRFAVVTDPVDPTKKTTSLVFSSFDHDGFLGDKFLVNGMIQPKLVVQRRKYRFRFLNASNARIYQLFLTDGSGAKYTMDMIATEGGLLSHPFREITSFMIAMAERVEVVIDFSKFADKTELFIENRLRQDDGRKPDGLMSSGPRILKFIVDGDPPRPDPSQVPDVLRPFQAISDEKIAAAYSNLQVFRFDRSHGGWTINGEFVDLERPVVEAKLNVPYIWRLVNDSGGWWHPIHIHSEFFRVIRRNGRTPSIPAPPARAWVPGFERDGFVKKDTILLRDNESVDVFLKFRDHLGPFVFHCHNMEHEDMAMMARFDVVP